MEEISWGQNVLHWQTPEFFAANSQGESNFHNLFQGVTNYRSEVVAALVLFLYGTCLPILSHNRRVRSFLHGILFVVPPPVLSPGFLLAAVMTVQLGREEEIGELFLGACLLLFMLLQHVGITSDAASAGIREGVITRVVSDLKDRRLYLLLLVSAAVLSISFSLGLKTLRPYSLDVGGEDDERYIRGFWDREWTAWSSVRWTSAYAYVVVPGARNLGVDLALSIHGPRPEGLPAPQVQVVAHERELASFTAEEEPTTYEVQYTPWIPSLDGDLVVEIFADTFVPSTGDRRTLGVVVDSVVATPVGTLYRAPWISLLALSAAIALSYPVLKSFGGTPAKGFIGALILLALIGCLMVVRVQGMLAFGLLLPGACGLWYLGYLAVRILVSPVSGRQASPVT